MTKVLFGDMVKEVKTIIDRKNNPYEFYIAGDHMDSEDLKIHRKGCFATDDVGPAFVREFKKGQILYGSRRTYLKKVAVADFDGITSNTTFVLESKNHKLFDQKLLPFLMLSDRFTRWSIEKSKGSTNPYILFSDLAQYSFELPSMEKQRELAQILWAAEETKQAYKSLLQKTDDLVKAKFEEMFGNINKQPKYPTIELGKISNMISGGTPSSKHPEYFGGTIPFVSTPCLGPNYINATNAQNWLTELGIKNSTTHLIPAYSLLVGNRVGIGKCSINTCELCTNQDILSFTEIDTNKYNLLFIKKVIEQYEYVFNIQKRGATIKGIPSNLVKSALIPQAPITIQNKFVQFAQQSEQSKQQLQKSLEQLNATTKALINENLK